MSDTIKSSQYRQSHKEIIISIVAFVIFGLCAVFSLLYGDMESGFVGRIFVESAGEHILWLLLIMTFMFGAAAFQTLVLFRSKRSGPQFLAVTSSGITFPKTLFKKQVFIPYEDITYFNFAPIAKEMYGITVKTRADKASAQSFMFEKPDYFYEVVDSILANAPDSAAKYGMSYYKTAKRP